MSSAFSPSPPELALVAQIFHQADPQKLGVLTGEAAVKVFSGSKISTSVLNEIWSIADEDNNGWLSKKGVAIAVRLMGWAQKGEKVSQALLSKPGPLPLIEGLTNVAKHNTGTPVPKSPPPGLPPLTPQDKAKFQRMFQGSGPVNGLLSGDKARDIFVKSKLPVDKLLQIWNLADTQDRGLLDSTEFAIGMYLIQASMSHTLQTIPASLPPGLYEQAGGSPQSNIIAHATGTSGSFSPNSTGSLSSNRSNLQPQYTGQSQILQPQVTGQRLNPAPRLPNRPQVSPIGSAAFDSLQGNGPVLPWDVTATEKANSDRFFNNLDSQRRGFIEGDVAVPFMLESKLSGDDLALIWDLADVNGDGRLTRDKFAVAMHLISKKLAGKEIPAAIPASLIPPSMRPSVIVSQQALPKAPEPPKDLFSWDETPPLSAAIPQQMGSTHNIPRQQSTVPQLSIFPEPFNSHSASNDPFGSSSTIISEPDLLGDDSDAGTTSPPLQDQSAEIGNVQNHLNSTNRSLTTTKAERAAIEQILANQAGQLSALQTQLSSAKAAYETETRLLSTLRERFTDQTTDIQKTREELIRAESDLSAVRVEKTEIEGSFLRDKEEARNLHKRMIEAGQQAEVLKTELEKLKKEAKQQKGLLAIARKQLSTKEAERTKVTKEVEEINVELASIVGEKAITEEELVKHSQVTLPISSVRGQSPDSVAFAAAGALPVTPDSVNISLLSGPPGKSNNPFERLAMTSGNSSPRTQSPFLSFADPSASAPSIAVNVDSPNTISGTPSEDPFGLSRALEQDLSHPRTDVLKETAVNPLESTSKEVTAKIHVPPDLDMNSPISAAGSEHYATPPTTAIGPSHSTSPGPEDPLQDAVEHFPPLDDSDAKFPSPQSNQPGYLATLGDHSLGNTETDLGENLKELDVVESDSDSNTDEDEVPLAELAKGKLSVDKGSEHIPLSSVNGNSSPLDHSHNASFDRAFGVQIELPHPENIPDSQPNVLVASNAFSDSFKDSGTFEPAIDSFGSPPADFSADLPASVPSVVGVNAFDEAMGKIPAISTTSAPTQFSFDSAFDDNFDFASTTEAPPPRALAVFPPAPTSVNGNASTKSPATVNESFSNNFATLPSAEATGTNGFTPHSSLNPLSFDDIFNTDPRNPSPLTAPTASAASAASVKNHTSVSFDDVFSGFEPTLALKLDSSPSAPPRPSIDSTTQKALPAVSAPTSPKGSPSSARTNFAPPTSSPPRQRSPPPRISSPKPRPSTSSSKDGHEKPQPPPTRHSKLSIRLPFGKKRKQEVLAPVASQFLMPPVEEPLGSTTPAVEDDVEAVKQLCGMGFSRSQAVLALETHSYDVQKALNSLLGGQ